MTAFLARNWVWIVFLGAFLAMHRAGYGCGMHGDHHHGHADHDHDQTDTKTPR
jgi:hypothetical protein